MDFDLRSLATGVAVGIMICLLFSVVFGND